MLNVQRKIALYDYGRRTGHKVFLASNEKSMFLFHLLSKSSSIGVVWFMRDPVPTD